MNAPNIEINKSNIPIVWLDTSILTKICIAKESPKKLDILQQGRIQRLHELLYKASREGKVICPLAEQEREVWRNRSSWLDTVNELSFGIECISDGEIEKRQIVSAMKAYTNSSNTISLSYRDAFFSDPVKELKEILQNPFYLALDTPLLFGEEYQKRKKEKTLLLLNKQREKNISDGISYQTQLKEEEFGAIRAILQMATDFLENKKMTEDENFNAWGAFITISTHLDAWEMITGNRDLGPLTEFYASKYYSSCPHNVLTTKLYARLMVDPQPIRSGDPMDIVHISSLMPYADLFVTDKAWSTFINRKSLHREYGTKVCYIGDFDEIERFFEQRC